MILQVRVIVKSKGKGRRGMLVHLPRNLALLLQVYGQFPDLVSPVLATLLQLHGELGRRGCSVNLLIGVYLSNTFSYQHTHTHTHSLGDLVTCLSVECNGYKCNKPPVRLSISPSLAQKSHPMLAGLPVHWSVDVWGLA